jgi:hypothetical protein
MAFHTLLDWRLAADLLGLIRGDGLDPRARWAELAASGVSGLCDGLGLEPTQAAGLPAARLGDDWILPLHPLENRAQAYRSVAVAEAVDEIETGGGIAHLSDYFNLLRRPAWVYGNALAD